MELLIGCLKTFFILEIGGCSDGYEYVRKRGEGEKVVAKVHVRLMMEGGQILAVLVRTY